MSNDNGHANLTIAALFVDELAERGMRHAVICPGSRSTPLAVTLAAHPSIRSWVLVDERSAAYFALGVARQLAAPVALLSTSGTAAANFLPAVIEAHLSRIPLLVLTADRPPELRDWGAHQTIDQVRLFGSHAKWFADMPLPADDPALHRHARATAARALRTAASAPEGPVHLNLPFREPLLPPDMRQSTDFERLFARARRSHADPDFARGTAASSDDLADVAGVIALEPRGVIVCGPGTPPGIVEPVVRLASLRGYPILADPLSTLRFGRHDRSRVITAYDSFLRDPETARALAPNVVLRVGALPTSKPLQQFLAAYPGLDHVLIDAGAPRDPFHLATRHVGVAPEWAFNEIAGAVGSSELHTDPSWASSWLEVDEVARDALACALSGYDAMSEARAAAELASLLPEGATLVAGNSMPIRDIDTFVHGSARAIRVVGTRGASGIDGVTSAALGAAAVTPGPVVLLTGDLSFFHDMNGLMAARRFGISATIVVINNDGGGIFSFLPQAETIDRETFEALFGTPIDLDIAGVASLYGASYARPRDWAGFRHETLRAFEREGLSIIEVVTNRQANVAQHRQISAAVLQALRSARQPSLLHA